LTFVTGAYILARTGTNTLILGSAGVDISATSTTPSTQVTTRITAVIAGTDGLTVTATPNTRQFFQLQGANTFTGPINLNGGITQFNNVSSVPNLGNSSNLVTVGAGAQFFANNGNATIANDLVLNNSTGVFSGDSLGTIRGAAGLIFSGSLTLQSSARITSSGTDTTGITINGQITGAGALEIGKTAAGSGAGGIVVFSNPANDFNGNLTISAGSQSRGTLKLAASDVIPNGTGTGNLTLNAGSSAAANLATLDLAGFNETINGLISSSGKPENNLVTNTGTSDSILTLGSNGATGSYSGFITDGLTNKLGITKIGSGVQTFGGANTYSGPTTVSEGTLSVTGSLGASAVTVNAGTLSGNGSFGGNVTIAPGATHSLAVASNPGAQDTSAITGTLAMADSILNLSVAAFSVEGEYVLATATDGITGTPASINYNGIIGEVTVDNGSNPKRLLLNVTGGTSPYNAWAILNSLEGINALPETDVENDGLSNLLEFVLGGNPNSNDTPSVLPKILDGPTAMTLTFKRSNDSEFQPVTVKVQVSAELATWNPADDILIGAANGTGPNGASYTVSPNGAFDDIVVTIPKNSANVKFARVQAVIP
jgi:autotransporter-associated beta strand protein